MRGRSSGGRRGVRVLWVMVGAHLRRRVARRRVSGCSRRVGVVIVSTGTCSLVLLFHRRGARPCLLLVSVARSQRVDELIGTHLRTLVRNQTKSCPYSQNTTTVKCLILHCNTKVNTNKTLVKHTEITVRERAVDSERADDRKSYDRIVCHLVPN